MHLLGIIRSHCTLVLVLFVAHFTARSHGQAASDFMDMESSTLSPLQENPAAPCKGDCEVLTQEIDTNTQFTDDLDSEEQSQQLTIDSKTTGFCTSPPQVPFATLKDDFLEQTVFPKGSIVSYECKTGYEHVPGADTFVKCVDDGWSPPDTFCKPNFCGPPPRLEYGIPKEEYLEKTVFPKGTEIKYICRLGYVRVPSSNSVVTCMADSTWSSPRTFCKPKSCGNPGDVDNGVMQAESFNFGSRVTYACNAGYKMISKRDYRDCQEDGKWSNVLPECIAVSCSSPLDIADGHYYPIKEDYTYLDSVKYICRGNRALIGQQIISCTEEGKWSSNAPECKAVQCLNPNVEHAIKLSGSRGPYILNSVVKFGCRQQYQLIGSNIVTCNQNSEWEPELPKCLGICRSAPHIPFTELVEPTADKTFLEGTTLKFRCIQGYEPVSVEENTATCSRLQWSYSGSRSCKPISCIEPEPVPYGKIISGSFTYGDRIMYACETGYVIKHQYRKCLSDRSWSLPIPECEVQTCATPANINHGWFGPEKEKYLYNDTITFTCHEGFELVGQSLITCRYDGRWNYQIPECRGICNAPPNFDHAQLQFRHTTRQTFFTGTTVQYTCKPGYYRDYRFIDTRTCLGNFTWSELSNDFCQIYTCPTPAFVRNGWYDPEMQEYLYNDTITYDCYEGFQLVGQGFLTCNREGRWNSGPPECRGICDNPPDLHYAQLDFRFKHQTTFFVGSTVQYNCRPGYISSYVHSNSISCLGNFTWSKIYSEFCNRISCGSPRKVAKASFEAKDFLFESEAIYTCEKGFKMVSQNKSVKCGANGRWSGSLPICEAQNCLPPEDLKDGSYSIKKDEYTYNEAVIYKCNTLQLVGKASVSCSDEGKWSSGAPQCKAVCTFPPELDFAVVEEEFIHQEFFDSGKAVQYKCRPGFVPVTGKSNKLTCLDNLKWSQHELFCTRISCGNPGAIEYGQMQSENFLFGSRVNYTCNPGYSIITKRNDRECQADGTWSDKPPVCKEPVCDRIWELQEEARKCTSTPDEWVKYLQVQYLYLQIENLKLDIEIKKRQLDSPIQTSSILHK